MCGMTIADGPAGVVPEPASMVVWLAMAGLGMVVGYRACHRLGF